MRVSKRKWEEAWLRDEDHVVRVLTLLVRDGVRFKVVPELDGWWVIRAEDHRSGDDQTGLHWMVQTSRVAA